MITHSFIGRYWNDVLEELQNDSRTFSYKLTFPRGKVKVKGNLRVVRVREDSSDQVELVLAHEFFVRSSEVTP